MASPKSRPADATPQPARPTCPVCGFALAKHTLPCYPTAATRAESTLTPDAAPLASSPSAEPKPPFRITVDKNRFYDALMALPDAPDIGAAGALVTCDCATTPPTMPTYRSEHLATCPVAQWQKTHSPPPLLGEAPLASAPSDELLRRLRVAANWATTVSPLLEEARDAVIAERLARETAERKYLDACRAIARKHNNPDCACVFCEDLRPLREATNHE